MAFSPEATPSEDGDEKKTKPKRRGSFAAPIPVENQGRNKVAPPRTSFDEALANMTLKRQEIAADKAETAKADKPKPEPETVEPTAVEAVSENLDTQEALAETIPEDVRETPNVQGAEELPLHELEPNEFSGGEVIIHLNGNRPIAERVITFEPVATEEPIAPVEQAPQPVAEPLVFTPQPEQQHQIRPETQSALPNYPAPVAEIAPQAPEAQQPEQPEIAYTQPATRTNVYPYVVAAAEQPASKRDVENAVYYAGKAGQNRGVLAGAIVAGGYEHFKHKRREKKQSKKLQKQSKELAQARAEYRTATVEQNTKRASFEQRVEKRFDNQPPAEKITAQRSSEFINPDQQEQLTVPAEHHLETSAWHTIEVDSKTGKAVENPAFQYGHEYYRERAHEVGPTTHRDAAAGEVALVAAAMDQTGSTVSGGTQPQIPNVSTHGSPQQASAKSQSQDGSKSAQSDSTTVLWPWAVALVAVIICLAIVLR